jgi:hypothetical protein
MFEFMVNFHHDICFILGIIFIMILYFLISINNLCLEKSKNFNIKDNKLLNNTKIDLNNNFTTQQNFKYDYNKKQFKYEPHNSVLEIT